jgi:hypothetical protein
MAKETEAIYTEARGKLPVLLSVTDGRQTGAEGNGEPVKPAFLPEADGITFHLKTSFLSSVPNNSPKGAQWTGLPVNASLPIPDGDITLSRIVGPFIQTGPNTFRLQFGRAEYTANHRNHDLWLAAAFPGDSDCRAIVQQAMVHAEPNTEGASQTITFPLIPDQTASTTSYKLAATADGGLPVSYYVREGPAEIEDGTIRFTPIPPHASDPIEVTVVAWQFGRSTEPRVKTAAPVERTFRLLAPPSGK